MPIRLRRDSITDLGIGLIHFVEVWLKNHEIKYERIEAYEYYDEPGKSDGGISHFYVVLSKADFPFPEVTGGHMTFRLD